MKLKFAVFIAVVLILTFGIILASRWFDSKPGYFGPEIQDASGKTVFQKVPDFSFQDQDGKVIRFEGHPGKIKLVNFFFSRCASICPRMSLQLSGLQQKLGPEWSGRYVAFSISVDPEHDTVPVLKQYASQYQRNGSNWHFLTGDKNEIYRIAAKGYQLGAAAAGENDFIHSDKIVLVDAEGLIRGYYSGTDPKAMKALGRDLKWLMRQQKGS